MVIVKLADYREKKESTELSDFIEKVNKIKEDEKHALVDLSPKATIANLEKHLKQLTKMSIISAVSTIVNSIVCFYISPALGAAQLTLGLAGTYYLGISPVLDLAEQITEIESPENEFTRWWLKYHNNRMD